MGNPWRALLDLPEQEKSERGLVHTPREIWQQPDTWRVTYELCAARQPELNAAVRQAGIGRGSTSSPTVYLVGAGTSDYTGRALAPLLRRRWGCDVWPLPSTTLLTEFEEFHRAGREYFWISFSRSGESPEGVALLERALTRYPQIRHLVITCNPQAPMAQLCAKHSDRAFALVLDDAVNDRGLAMTSSFSNMLLAGQCVAHLDDFPQFGDVVSQLSEVGHQFLPVAGEAASEATALGCTRACFVGSGVLRAVADECTLKVVELSAGKITTLAETPLGLRHGPMSSVDDQTIFVTFLSGEPRRRGYELDLLREINRKRLGKIRLAVTSGDGRDVAELADCSLPLGLAPGFDDHYRPVLDVILGQSIGLFASMRSGLMPDQPSPTGTITRVVQPIQLYS
ncbi:MAG TPA: tagatose-6-phosphate ketose isomerase [Candidatus Sulfotelmatobacter sp.]|nr:tagatose-6-phosphate ketose isomerase [Candidatus Sulfotelmatobacter sp.]